MIHFIVCDDNEHVREFNITAVSKATMPFDFNYKMHTFEKYNDSLKKIINDTSGIKIYILDLELPGKTGIDIVREIRKVDWDSIVIILTSHDELEFKLLKEKLLIFDFISKFDNYSEKLEETLKLIISKINNKKIISFKSNKELHHLKLDDIYYVYRDNALEKTVIVTDDNKYAIRESLQSLITKLDPRFRQSHRACYINKDKVTSIDFKNNMIYFDNDTSTDYLSRNYKKDLRDLIWD